MLCTKGHGRRPQEERRVFLAYMGKILILVGGRILGLRRKRFNCWGSAIRIATTVKTVVVHPPESCTPRYTFFFSLSCTPLPLRRRQAEGCAGPRKKKMNDQQHDGEIVGLHASTNGRSCNQHECCGRHLQPGQIVRLKTEVMEVVYETPGDPEPDARVETVIKAVLVLHGTELCTVGFLPRHVAARPQEAARLNNKFAQIIELYDETAGDLARHTKSRRNHGMASYVLLENVPEMH